jgi:hypothetical protein
LVLFGGDGGFGGGGGGGLGGGGGGGYSGGGGGNNNSPGGGGGSFLDMSAINPILTAGSDGGGMGMHGLVTIDLLSSSGSVVPEQSSAVTLLLLGCFVLYFRASIRISFGGANLDS